jgi:transposase-like protein
MAKVIYSAEEIKALRSNPNVKKCSERSITYSPTFKQRAIKQYYEEGLSPNQIFIQAGFDLSALGKDKPKACLKLWRRIYRAKGLSALATDIDPRGKNRLGKKKSKYDESDSEYLKVKIAYLEAENAFLRKLKTKPNN